MDNRREEAGEVSGIGIRWQVALQSRALEPLAYCSLARRAAQSQFLPDGIGRLSA
jgi:hypothetical protein